MTCKTQEDEIRKLQDENTCLKRDNEFLRDKLNIYNNHFKREAVFIKWAEEDK